MRAFCWNDCDETQLCSRRLIILDCAAVNRLGRSEIRKQFDGIAFANHPLREDSVVNAGHAFMRLRDQA